MTRLASMMFAVGVGSSLIAVVGCKSSGGGDDAATKAKVAERKCSALEEGTPCLEALNRLEGDISSLQQQSHQRYSDSEAITAMGLMDDDNPLRHTRFTPHDVIMAMGEIYDGNPLRHQRYTDAECIAAMGPVDDDNPLHHQPYTDQACLDAVASVGYLTAEYDPEFGMSAASDITSSDIADWRSAAAWGDHGAAGYQRYARTVVVRAAGTPTDNGRALTQTLHGIGDASEENRYLVKLEPGTYDMSAGSGPLELVSHVDIEGSGEAGTVITNQVQHATVIAADQVEMRWLTIASTRDVRATCVLNEGSHFKLTHVTLLATGSYPYAVDNEDGAVLELSHVTVRAINDDGSDIGILGITNNDATLVMDASLVEARGGRGATGLVVGTISGESSAIVRRSRIEVQSSNAVSSAYAVGLSVGGGAFATVKQSEISATSIASAGYATGVAVQQGMVTLRHTEVSATGGPSATGVSVANNGQVDVQGATVEAEGSDHLRAASVSGTGAVFQSRFVQLRATLQSPVAAPNAIAVSATNGAFAMLHSCVVEADAGHGALYVQAPAAAGIGATQIDGFVNIAPGSATCVGAYDGSFAALPTACQ